MSFILKLNYCFHVSVCHSLPSGVVLVCEDVGKSEDGFHYWHILSNTHCVIPVLTDGPQCHCRVS